MAYGLTDYVNLINQYKDSNPGLAYAIYNGVGQSTNLGNSAGGALDQALRNAWGDQQARDWVNHGDTLYGSGGRANFDPNTGQYGYYDYGTGQTQSGTLSGWNTGNAGQVAWPTTAVANTYNPGTGTVTGSAANGFSPPPTAMNTIAPTGPIPGSASGTPVNTGGGLIANNGGTNATTPPSSGGHTPLIGSTAGYSNPLPISALAATGTPPPAGGGMPPPAGGGGYNPGSSGTVTPPPAPNTNSAINPGTSTGPQSLLSTAQSILGSSFLTNPDGSPNWTAMSTPDFFNTLTDQQKVAMENAHLGAAIRASLGLPLLPGQSVPSWYSSATNPNQNTGASGGFPTADPATYTPTNASGYAIRTRPTDAAASTPFDFLNDPGYQFILQQGLNQVQNRAAATGDLHSGATLKALSDYTTGAAQQFYQQAFQDYMAKQQQAENQYQYDTNTGAQNYWNTQNFNNNAAQWAASFNNNNTQWATNFNNSNRIDARNYDEQAAIDQRNYQTALDQYNQQFGYNAAVGDRNFNAQTLQALAQMGLNGSSSAGQIASVLAGLISNNNLTGAGAGANATVGGANNINTLIGNIMQYLQANNLIQQFVPQNQNTTTTTHP